MNSQSKALIQLHSAVFLFGGTALFSHLIQLSALDITVYRTAIAAVTLFIILSLLKQPIKLNNKKDYGVVFILSTLVGLHWVTYFASMQLASIAIGIISFFTYPIVTVFLSPLFGYGKIQLKDLLLALVVLLGIFLLVPEFNVENDITLGVATGVFSGVLFALRNLVQKRHFSHYSGPQTMFYQTLITSILLLPWLTTTPLTLELNDALLALLAGVIFTAVPHALFASSLRNLSPTTIGLISCLQPLYGTFLAYMLLGDHITMTTFIGGFLVVSAACIETWSITRSKS